MCVYVHIKYIYMYLRGVWIFISCLWPAMRNKEQNIFPHMKGNCTKMGNNSLKWLLDMNSAKLPSVLIAVEIIWVARRVKILWVRKTKSLPILRRYCRECDMTLKVSDDLIRAQGRHCCVLPSRKQNSFFFFVN